MTSLSQNTTSLSQNNPSLSQNNPHWMGLHGNQNNPQLMGHSISHLSLYVKTEGSRTNGGFRDRTCAICLEDVPPGSDGGSTQLSRCVHRFHTACISNYCRYCLARSRLPTCPICREDIEMGLRLEDGDGVAQIHHYHPWLSVAQAEAPLVQAASAGLAVAGSCMGFMLAMLYYMSVQHR